MNKKLMKHFKGKYIQIAVEGMIMAGKLIDSDDDWLYFGDDNGVQIAVPMDKSPILVDSNIQLTDNIDEMMTEVMNEKKGSKIQ